MQRLNLEQFRITTETGGILSVSIVGEGGAFHIEAETRRGNIELAKSRGNLRREFRDATKALTLLREIGIREARVDTRNWRPELIESLRASRPDRSAALSEAFEASKLKKLLEARIREADDHNSVLHDADDVFDELEAQYAS